MKHIFLILSIISFAFNVQANGIEIKEISSIVEANEIIQTLNKDSLVIFDVDQTLLTSNDERYLITQNDKESIKVIIDEYTNGCKKNYDKSKEHPIDYFINAERILMEEEFFHFIQNIKSKHTPIIALTQLKVGNCRNINSLEDWRYKQLRELGLDFSDSFKFNSLEFNNFAKFNGTYPVFYKGILMTNDVSKGDLLIEFLKRLETEINWKPKIIYFFDDKLHHNQSVAKSLNQIGGFNGRCYYYLKGSEWINGSDPQISKKKTTFMLKFSRWPQKSDNIH